MPLVNVVMLKGRSVEQKRGLVKALTEAMVQYAAAKPDNLIVHIEEVEKENWAMAGVLAADSDH